jgi:hypothetical protein
MVFVVIAMFFAFLYYHFIREKEGSDVLVTNVSANSSTNKIVAILASLEKVEIDTDLFVNPKKEGYLLRLSDFKKFDPKPDEKSPNKQNIFIDGPGSGYRSLDLIQAPADDKHDDSQLEQTINNQGDTQIDSINSDDENNSEDQSNSDEDDSQDDSGGTSKVQQTNL